MSSEKSRFILVDGHAVLYRAFHAFPELSTPDGQPINAVYGFTRILLAALRDQQPDYVAVTFDHKMPTLRSKEYAEYKAQRPPMPESLQTQIPLVKEVVTALNMPQFELEGYEADDLIGTITQQLITDKAEVLTVIISGDKDLFQLVDDHTHVWLPARGKFASDVEYDHDQVITKMGVRPDQVVDLKALMGDSSDNIPGVPGIGQKTAVTLLQEFGSLDALYAEVDKVVASEVPHPLIKGAVKTKLVAGKELAYLSQKLATINRGVPITFQLSDCTVTDYNKQAVYTLFERFGFKSLMSQLPSDAFETEVQGALF